MRKITSFVAFIVSMGFVLPSIAQDVLQIDARVLCKKPTAISVSLENRSSSVVEIDESLLPWNHFNVIRLEAYHVVDGKSKRLVEVAPIADFLRKISIRPGIKVNGEILLNRSFAEFEDLNSTGDILVFYRINAAVRTGSIPFSGASGTILIPRQSFFSQGCPVLITPRLLGN